MSDAAIDAETVLEAPEHQSTAPAFPEIVVALGSIALLGAVAGLGSGDSSIAVRAIPSGLGIGVGTALLSAPALLVAHQFLGLRGRPEALADAMARALTRLGTLCLGAVPVLFFFSVTSRLALGLFPVVLAAAGLFCLLRMAGELMAVEADTPAEGRMAREGTMGLLVLCWLGMVCLIAGRISWDVAWFVLS